MDALCSLAKAHDLPLIEDAAQAIGATSNGRRVGALGTLGCFSFFPTKNLGAFGDGGLVTTEDDRLAVLARSLRSHGFGAKHHSLRLGGNFRLDALQAAVLRAKLPHLDRLNALRRSHAEGFAEAASKSMVVPRERAGTQHVYNQFVVRCAEREKLAAHLLERGIPSERYYPTPLHLQPTCAHLGYGPGDFPEAEAAARETLALPIYPELEPWMRAAIADALSEFGC
jgi:dTDP-4-amino-4,6-dideoxygalactose transaminase